MNSPADGVDVLIGLLLIVLTAAFCFLPLLRTEKRWKSKRCVHCRTALDSEPLTTHLRPSAAPRRRGGPPHRNPSTPQVIK